jgi:hypothetical protein
MHNKLKQTVSTACKESPWLYGVAFTAGIAGGFGALLYFVHVFQQAMNGLATLGQPIYLTWGALGLALFFARWGARKFTIPQALTWSMRIVVAGGFFYGLWLASTVDFVIWSAIMAVFFGYQINEWRKPKNETVPS